MTKRDVQLVIRARNEADRALRSVADSLENLRATQESVQESSTGVGASIGEMGAGLRSMERVINQSGAAVARAMGQIDKAIDKSVEAYARQESQLRNTKEAYAATVQQIKAAERAIASTEIDKVTALASGDTEQHARMVERLKAAQRAYNELTRDAQKFDTSLSEQSIQLAETSTNLDRLKSAAAGARLAQKDFSDASAQAETTTRDLSAQIDRQSASTRRMSTAMTYAAAGTVRMQGGFQGLYGESRKAMSIAQRLRGEVLALATAYLGLYNAINQIQGVVDAFRAVEAAQNRLGVVFGQNMARVNAEMAFLREQAARLGVEFGTLSREYSAFAFAAREANFTNDETRRVFLELTEAGRVFNLTTDEMSGIFRALVQIMSKGKIQAEELRGQLGDRLSGAFQIMAAALGKTSQELDEMLERGEVLADSNTLLSFADEMEQRFGPQLAESLRSVSAEIGRFQNNVFEAQRRVAEGGFLAAFTDGLRRLNEWFQSDDGEQFFDTLSVVLTKATEAVIVLSQNLDTLLLLFQAFVSVKLAQTFFGLAGTMRGTLTPQLLAARRNVIGLQTALLNMSGTANTTVTRALRTMGVGLVNFRRTALVATAAARTFWAAIGGIPGIVITGLSFVLTSFLGQWITGVDQASRALEEHRRNIESVRAEYVEARGEVASFTDELRNASVNTLTIDARNLRRDIARVRREVLRETVNFGTSLDGRMFSTDIQREFRDLVGLFNRGQITAVEFRAAVDELTASVDDPAVTAFRNRLSEITERGVETEDALARTEAAIRLVTGQAREGDAELLDLAGALGDANDAAADTSGLEAYRDALRELEDAIPELSRLNDLRDEIDTIREQTRAGLDNASSNEERRAILERRNRALAAVQREQVDGVDYGSIVDRIAPAGADTAARLQLETELREIAQRLANVRADVTETNVLTARLIGGDRPELAIKYGLRGDISAQRQEAQTILGRGDTEVALDRERQRLLAEATREQRDYNQAIDAANAGRRFEIEQLEQSERQQTINAAIREAEVDAQKDGVTLDAARRQEIEDSTAALFDAEARQRALTEIAEAQLELAEARGETETRTAFIARELQERKIDALSREGQLLAGILGATYDINEARRQANAADDTVNTLEQQRQILEENIEFLREQGDYVQADALQNQLDQVNQSLIEAIDNAIAFWEALGGPDAQNAILGLQLARDRLEAVGETGVVSADQINRSFASGVATAFDNFAQKVVETGNVIRSLRDAFLQFAADFLRQIAQMIIQQTILNMLKNSSGGGIGGFIARITAGVAHTGGIAGQLTTQRNVSPAAFVNATRYHTGGIAGLRPGEVPAILKRGEEVLTEQDPRHVGNLGGEGINLEIVNAFDADEVVSRGLSSASGVKTLLNVVGSNKGAFKAAIS